MVKIYTKTGDNGTTGLYDGSRVLKDNMYINALGDIDELNSFIGNIIALSNNKDIDEIKILNNIQHWLFDMGSIIAMPTKKDSNDIIFDIDNVYSKQLEYLIDKMTAIIPKLTKFILPGGNIEIANIHITRSVCRRAERGIVYISEYNNYVKINCIKFINRLSDYLFTLARYVCHLNNIPEVFYVKNIL